MTTKSKSAAAKKTTPKFKTQKIFVQFNIYGGVIEDYDINLTKAFNDYDHTVELEVKFPYNQIKYPTAKFSVDLTEGA
jgi:hypothetical protein